MGAAADPLLAPLKLAKAPKIVAWISALLEMKYLIGVRNFLF